MHLYVVTMTQKPGHKKSLIPTVGLLVLFLVIISPSGFPAKRTLQDGGFRDEFRNIAVYVGPGNPVESLLSLPRKKKKRKRMYSQAHQDKIVLALTKEIRVKNGNAHSTPYFVDLAANDAIYISNTVRLEQHGWTGLCIGECYL